VNERATVKKTVESDPFLSLHCVPVLYEDCPAASVPAFEGALQCLDGCQIYLLIVYKQYGTRIGDLSITHLEYRRAKEKNLHILVFVRKIRREEDREEGTWALLSELKGWFKYKEFDTVITLEKEVCSALVQLLKDKFKTQPPQEQFEQISPPRKRSLSLRWVLALCFLVLVGGVLAWVSGRGLLYRWRLYRLQTTQRHVQAIEQELQRLHPPVPAMYQGVLTYLDGSKKKLAEDRWNDGRLEWRTLYSDGQAVARDVFRYEDGRLSGKDRFYSDDTKLIFLVDEFASDGVLITKWDCPEGLGPNLDYS